MSMLEFFRARAKARVRRSVELRALCNEVPRTPPGPEGSNGTGYASGAADNPKFLSPLILKLKAGNWKPPHELSGHCAQVAAANVSGSRRPAARYGNAQERDS